MRTSVVSYLDDFIRRGDGIAFTHRRGLRTERWTYERTARTAFQFAGELESRGIGKGERVLLWAQNSPAWVACFFGCLLRGVIVVPLDVQSDPAFVARVQQQVEAQLAVYDSHAEQLRGLNLPLFPIDEVSSLNDQPSYDPAEINQDDIAEIIFTSGTTGEPKGVVLTHGNLIANLNPLDQEIKRYLRWERLVHPLRFLNLVPLSHVFGQFMGAFVPQLVGGEVFFQESLSPSQIIETAKRERISVVVAVPRVLESLRESIERIFEADNQLNRFRKAIEAAEHRHFIVRWWKFRRVHRMFGWKCWAFVSGGASLNEETEKFWRRLGFAVIQGYGMTETAALVSVIHPFKSAPRSIGKVMPGAELKLAENGEILVRGDNVSPGYWRADAETGRTADHEWFRTGDVGELDEQGNLYFKGRKKEVIVTSAGVNIYPDDIESALNHQPDVKASAVIEHQTAQGPEPLAVLILRPQANAKEIIDRANESLAQYQRVRNWYVWPQDDFPRTGTQKIRKQMIAERVREALSAATPLSEVQDQGPLTEVLSRITREGTGRFESSAKLGTDLKLDSLGRVELLSALEDRYQIDIDEAAFTDATTIAELETIVRAGTQEKAAPYPYPRWQQRWPVSWLRVGLLYSIVSTAIRIMGRPSIKGKKHLQNLRGPAVFICNHVTMLDHALVLFALPMRFKTRMVIAQDGEILRDWRHSPPGTGTFRRLINLLQYFLVVLFFNVFSMPQKSGFRRSFGFAGEMLDRGYNLMVFPEGERTKHGKMNPFRLGAGLLIKELGVPVVPMRIHGLWKLKQANRHFAWPGEVSVSVGEPVSYANEDAPEQIARDLARRVTAL